MLLHCRDWAETLTRLFVCVCWISSAIGTVVHTFQYSVTEYFTRFGDDSMKLPGVHFKYDMSAIAVKLREKKTRFLHFLTRMCATIGGAFALTSMANAWVYRLTKM